MPKIVSSKKNVEYQIDIGADGSGMPFALSIGRMHAMNSRTMAKGGVKKENPRIRPKWIITDKRIRTNKNH
jgi:hypothetical protein